MDKERGALESYVCKRLKERFDIELSHNQYLTFNKKSASADIMTSSKKPNCDYRRLNFLDKEMVVIYDRLISRVKTVLVPDEEYKVLKRGDIVSGKVVKIHSSGYLIELIDSKTFISLNFHKERQGYQMGDTVDNIFVISSCISKDGKFRITAVELEYILNSKKKKKRSIKRKLKKIKESITETT
jgi:hypothetical protein